MDELDIVRRSSALALRAQAATLRTTGQSWLTMADSLERKAEQLEAGEDLPAEGVRLTLVTDEDDAVRQVVKDRQRRLQDAPRLLLAAVVEMGDDGLEQPTIEAIANEAGFDFRIDDGVVGATMQQLLADGLIMRGPGALLGAAVYLPTEEGRRSLRRMEVGDGG